MSVRHWVVLLAFLPACNRVEEPPSSAGAGAGRAAPTRSAASPTARPAPTPTAPEPAPAPPSASAPPPCLVPTPETPPPVARPAESCPVPDRPAPKFARGKVRIPDAPGAPELAVEFADTMEQQAWGLMYRTQLGPNEGMLFRSSEERIRTFWMKNTCIPLDMLFVARDGTILGILEQVPVLNLEPRSVPCPAAYVLEVNAGYCREHGVKAGMRITVE